MSRIRTQQPTCSIGISLYPIHTLNITFHHRIYIIKSLVKLLPEYFTLTQLQSLYEAINGYTLDKRNFRKRVAERDYIEKTRLIDKTTSRRGASLYKFNEEKYKKSQRFKI